MTESFPGFAELQLRDDRPSPLEFIDGRRVTDAGEWAERKRELQGLFLHYMYGQMPEPVAVRTTLRFSDDGFHEGKATLEEWDLAGHLGGRPFQFRMLLATPKSSRPSPAFASLNFHGNHTMLAISELSIPEHWIYESAFSDGNRPSERGRGAEREAWDVIATLDAGFAFATVCGSDIEPDTPDTNDGVRALRPELDWGAVSAWAWGFLRSVDVLTIDPRIDPSRIYAVGHSRNGKAVGLAAAYDERIALTIPLQAGCGGTAPSRTSVGETIRQINEAFPHWFNARFKQFNGAPQRLPFDQGSLFALVAPRRILFANAEEDLWANPAGQFDVLNDAFEVYRLLGVSSQPPQRLPLGQAPEGRLGYFMRTGGHSMTREDWQAFRAFARG